MRMWTRNRGVSALMTVSYLLTVTMASLFHNHAISGGGGCCHEPSPAHESSHDCHHGESDEHSSPPNTHGISGQCSSDGNSCPVCQFLGQKTAPAAELALVFSGALVQKAVLPAPASMVVGVFSAWHSRGPPVLA